MKIRFFFLLICFLSAGYSWRLHAKIVLPAMFTDNMVLQRQTEVAFWGTATPRCTVTIKTSLNNKEYLVIKVSGGQEYLLLRQVVHIILLSQMKREFVWIMY